MAYQITQNRLSIRFNYTGANVSVEKITRYCLIYFQNSAFASLLHRLLLFMLDQITTCRIAIGYTDVYNSTQTC